MLHASPTMPDSRPATIHELDVTARQHFDVAPGSNTQLRDCLHCAEEYRTQADSLTKFVKDKRVDDKNVQVNDKNGQGGSSSCSTGDVQVDLERGYISYARAQILIAMIYRHPQFQAELTEQERADLAVDLEAINRRLTLLNRALVDRWDRSPHKDDPGAIPAFKAADQRDAERQAQRAPAPTPRNAIARNNGRCVGTYEQCMSKARIELRHCVPNTLAAYVILLSSRRTRLRGDDGAHTRQWREAGGEAHERETRASESSVLGRSKITGVRNGVYWGPIVNTSAKSNAASVHSLMAPLQSGLLCMSAGGVLALMSIGVVAPPGGALWRVNVARMQSVLLP
ncbi:hypothetical protein B0H19DRAFT_1235452 [Mycena capillaripes]|nr:hypothetical protein B0H19DRAFT_1235452 [Mycena capillaripes]